ncbi:MAG: DUF222 domain-containing protein, partial [Nocardioidaceae bacterium]
MTAQAFAPLRPVPGPETGVLGSAVRVARNAVGTAIGLTRSRVSDVELEAALADAAALEAQAAALKVRLLAEADRRQMAELTGATGTDAWAAGVTGATRHVMSGGLWLGRLLEQRYPTTAAAFGSGRIDLAQVWVIVRAAEKLPAGVTAEQRTEAETGLVLLAVDGVDARRLRQRARRMLERIDRELADEHEATQLDDEEKRAERETWFSLHDNGDGTVSGRFVIPELHGEMLRQALERLTSPRRLGRNRAGGTVVDPTLPGSGPSLSRTEWFGLGFCELLEHLPTAESGGFSRVGATVMVHLELAHLVDGLASARLDTGARISAGEARRLACNAGLVPSVLGGRSEVLDVGREQRLHTVAMRRSLSHRHETCAAEGCERPFAWCDIHHPHAWSAGGVTSVD